MIYERIRNELREITKIPIDDTKLTIIDINDVNGVGKVYIGNIEHSTQRRTDAYANR